MSLFYDRFMDSYVNKTDPYAAPERYVEILRNDDPIFTEKWSVITEAETYHKEGPQYYIFSFTAEEYDRDVSCKRREGAESLGVRLGDLVALAYPPEMYDRIAFYQSRRDQLGGG